MNGDFSIPPLRDLPPHRLAERREHLISEIAQPPSRRPLPRRGLLALVAAALIVVVGAASAIGGVRAIILDRGFIGLPPVGATPSAPESGELVIRWLGRSKTLARGPYSAPLFRVWVYADGRVIWSQETPQSSRLVPEAANELTSGYLEQRLTPEGVELLRLEVIGLLQRSGIPLETIPTEDEPVRFGVEVRDGDRLVRANCCWDPDWDRQGSGTATPEQLAAFRRVDALLTDTASVLPPSAWAVREIRAYVPSHYQVCMGTSPRQDVSDLLSLLPARAADLLRDRSRTSSEDDVVSNIDQEPGHMVVIGRSVTYCSKLATEEAREVAEALSGLDQDPNFHGVVLAYRVAEAVNNLTPTSIWFEPYFPHGQVACSSCG